MEISKPCKFPIWTQKGVPNHSIQPIYCTLNQYCSESNSIVTEGNYPRRGHLSASWTWLQLIFNDPNKYYIRCAVNCACYYIVSYQSMYWYNCLSQNPKVSPVYFIKYYIQDFINIQGVIVQSIH